MKSKDELIAITAEVEALNKKLAELNDEDLQQVIGGIDNRKDYSREQWKDLLLYLLKNS